MAFAPQDRDGIVVTASDDLTVGVFRVDPAAVGAPGGEPVQAVRFLRHHDKGVTAVRFAGKSTLVSASRDNGLAVWDTSTWEVRQTLRNCHDDWVNCLAVHAGKWLASGSNDFKVKVWSITSEGTLELQATLAGHLGAVNGLDFLALPNKRVKGRGSSKAAQKTPYVVSAAFDGAIKVWDVQGTELTTISAAEVMAREKERKTGRKEKERKKERKKEKRTRSSVQLLIIIIIFLFFCMTTIPGPPARGGMRNAGRAACGGGGRRRRCAARVPAVPGGEPAHAAGPPPPRARRQLWRAR